MKKNTTETIIRLIELAGSVFFKTCAIFFAVIALYAVVCLFTGDGIIALIGAGAAGIVSRSLWVL